MNRMNDVLVPRKVGGSGEEIKKLWMTGLISRRVTQIFTASRCYLQSGVSCTNFQICLTLDSYEKPHFFFFWYLIIPVQYLKCPALPSFHSWFLVCIFFFFNLFTTSWGFICRNSLRPGLKLCSSRDNVHLLMSATRKCYQPEKTFNYLPGMPQNIVKTWNTAETLHRDLRVHSHTKD